MSDIGNELRWILLAFGIVLIAGLYITGRWGRRQSAHDDVSRDAKRQPAEFAAPEYAHSLPQLHDVVRVRERPIEPRVTIVDDQFLDDLPQVRIDSPGESAHVVEQRWESSRADTDAFDDMPEPDETVQPHIESATIEPSNEFAAELRTVAATAANAKIDSSVNQESTKEWPTVEPIAPAKTTSKPSAKPASKVVGSRKIVALRLISGAQRFDGAELKDVMEAAKLRHGKYGIYHRQDDEGLTLFSVASMVEPGTFEPSTMHAHKFQGVTFFAQLPGPIDGVLMFEQMLECAERLAGILGGAVQDERGVVLSPQRTERIRDEIADFQHLVGFDTPIPTHRSATDTSGANFT